MKPAEITEMTVRLTERANAALERTVAATRDTRIDVVNQALAVYAELVDLHRAGGGDLRFDLSDGSTVRVDVDRRGWFG